MFLCDGILWESRIRGSVTVFVAISVDATGCFLAGLALPGGLGQWRALLSEHRMPPSHPTTTKTVLWAEKENKLVPNNWDKDGSRCVSLSRNAQNPGYVLVGASLCCGKEICSAKTLDIITNKQQQQRAHLW